MRVVHVISSLDARQGGPGIALIALAAAQVRAGLEVTVLATHQGARDSAPPREVAASLAAAGLRATLVGPARGPLCRHPDLAPAARDAVAAADVVHVHALWEEIQHQTARAARAAARPYVLTPHGMLDPWSLAQSRWKKKLYLAWRLRKTLDRAASLHFTSDTERDLTAPLRLAAPAIVEPNGVDLAEFETLPPPGTFTARYPQLAGRKVLLFLSRLHYKKGLDLLIPAFAAIANPFPDWTLVLAGPDADGYRATLEQLVRRHDLAGRVLFTGMLHGPDRVAALADADLFVLPSYQENFGIAVIEALAAGTPVVVSDGVNIHAQITARGVGGVAPLGPSPAQSVAALAGELSRWLADAGLRRAAAERARPLVWAQYDWHQIARRWADHYRRLRESPGGGGGG